MAADHHDGVSHPKKGNAIAVFAYLWILIIIPFLTDAKSDPFVKYHLKQGLALILLELVGWVISWFPFVGWFVGWIISLVALVLAIIGIINVLNGQEKELPLIGHYAKNFNF
jgi:uncharacterized membrane protein